MKKLLLVLLFPVLAMAQDKISTSEEEYKYLTEGYKIQQETGTDLKSGYELVKVDERSNNGYSFTFSLFNHLQSKTTRAVSIVMKKDKDKKDKMIYMCMPIDNKELFLKFFKDTENLGFTMKTIFDLTMYDVLQKYVNKTYNK